MIVELFGGRHLEVDDETGHRLDELLTAFDPPERVKLGEQTVKLSEITNLWTNDAWVELEHERAGDWRCVYLKWHTKGEKCGHTAPPKQDEGPIDLGWLRGTSPDPMAGKRTEYQEKFIELMRFNFKWGIEHPLPPKPGGVQRGPFRTVEEWDKYLEDGTVPPLPPKKPRTRFISVADPMFPGGKRKLVEVPYDQE